MCQVHKNRYKGSIPTEGKKAGKTMNKKLYLIFYLICFIITISISACGPNESNTSTNRTQTESTQDKLAADGNKQNETNTGEKVIETNAVKSGYTDTSNHTELTIDKIKQSYNADEKILSILEYENYVLVESQVPTYTNRYILYDFKNRRQGSPSNW